MYYITALMVTILQFLAIALSIPSILLLYIVWVLKEEHDDKDTEQE